MTKSRRRGRSTRKTSTRDVAATASMLAEFTVADRALIARGRPTSRNRKRLQVAQTALSNAITVTLFGNSTEFGSTETLAEVA